MAKKDLVDWEREEDLGIITIDNPPVNALGDKVIEEIKLCLEELKEDEEVRTVIVTGAGEKAFMAGADITELPNLIGQPGAAAKFSSQVHQMFNAMDLFPKPTIAAVNGVCLGGGCELALATDIRIVAEKAKFGLPEVTLGILPGGGGTQRLPRLVGEGKAKELMYLGNHITADEALNIGLVNRVVADNEVLEVSKEIGKEIAKRPGVAVNLIKQCVDRGMETSIEEGLRIESDLFDRTFLTEDAKEGINAFIEKRKPNFKHR